MTKKLNEETTYSASVTMNDGEGNKTASINTDDYNELERFLSLAGVKAPGNNSSSLPPSCGEGWADDNPMNMDAAGYETGGDAEEVNVVMPETENAPICPTCDGEGYFDLEHNDVCPTCDGQGYMFDEVEEDYDTQQAEYDHGHVPDRPRPYSMDVHDYKGHPEANANARKFDRVNNQGDNALPKHNEAIEESEAQQAADWVRNYMDKAVETDEPVIDYVMDKFGAEYSIPDSHTYELTFKDGSSATFDTRTRELLNIDHGSQNEEVDLEELDRLTQLAGAPAYKIKKVDEKEVEEALGEEEVDEARARPPNNREDTMMTRIDKNERAGKDVKYEPRPEDEEEDKYTAMARRASVKNELTLEELEAELEEEMQSFLGEFGNRNPVATHPLHDELMSSTNEMIRLAGNIEDAIKSVSAEYSKKMQIEPELIVNYLDSKFNKLNKDDIMRSQNAH